ncbi:hypothetical protein ASC97_10295 [Rhizobium sp. Root1203]|nr:hypothetical protein ASC97_10295 [Rhizobium sp. Root1203]
MKLPDCSILLNEKTRLRAGFFIGTFSGLVRLCLVSADFFGKAIPQTFAFKSIFDEERIMPCTSCLVGKVTKPIRPACMTNS